MSVPAAGSRHRFTLLLLAMFAAIIGGRFIVEWVAQPGTAGYWLAIGVWLAEVALLGVAVWASGSRQRRSLGLTPLSDDRRRLLLLLAAVPVGLVGVTLGILVGVNRR